MWDSRPPGGNQVSLSGFWEMRKKRDQIPKQPFVASMVSKSSMPKPSQGKGVWKGQPLFVPSFCFGLHFGAYEAHLFCSDHQHTHSVLEKTVLPNSRTGKKIASWIHYTVGFFDVVKQSQRTNGLYTADRLSNSDAHSCNKNMTTCKGKAYIP